MKVYISVDMEGIGGISHNDPTRRGDDGYPAAVALMVGEANAAIDGAFAGPSLCSASFWRWPRTSFTGTTR